MHEQRLTNRFTPLLVCSSIAFVLALLLLVCGSIMVVPLLLVWSAIAVLFSGGMTVALFYSSQQMKKEGVPSAIPGKIFALLWLVPAFGCFSVALGCLLFCLCGLDAVGVMLGMTPYTSEAFSIDVIESINTAYEGEGVLIVLLLWFAITLLIDVFVIGVGLVVLTKVTLRCTKAFPQKTNGLSWLCRGFGILCFLICPVVCYGLFIVCLVPSTDATLYPFSMLCAIGVLICSGIGGLLAGRQLSLIVNDTTKKEG